MDFFWNDPIYFPQGANQWYELQDLHVKEILPQMITLSDSYIQVTMLILPPPPPPICPPHSSPSLTEILSDLF